jgi:hypothetical protein
MAKKTPENVVQFLTWDWGCLYRGTREAFAVEAPELAPLLDAIVGRKRSARLNAPFEYVEKLKGGVFEIRRRHTAEELKTARLAEAERQHNAKRYARCFEPGFAEKHRALQSQTIRHHIHHFFNFYEDGDLPWSFDDEVLEEAAELAARLTSLFENSEMRIRKIPALEMAADGSFQRFMAKATAEQK